MQQPTIADLHVRTTADARIIFHAVRHDMLPMVRRRLDADERRSIKSGDVFVWEERCNAEASGVIMQTSHSATLFLQYSSSWALSDGRIPSVGVPVAQEM
jgi:hypothetical protein